MTITLVQWIIISIIFLYGAFLFVRDYLVVVRVDGDSMFPTLRNKWIYLALKTHKRPTPGKIYIYYNPQGVPVIKRLKYINEDNGLCYFLGDNSNNSIDSRHYGFIKEENIIAELIWFYKRK